MKDDRPKCLLCGRPVTATPERFFQMGHVAGYVCYGCGRLDPQRLHDKIVKRQQFLHA